MVAYPEMAEILVAHGADLGVRDSAGSTPLHAAVERPELADIMEALLELGAEVNAVDNSGLTPMDIAVSREEDEKLELLENYGARSSKADSGLLPGPVQSGQESSTQQAVLAKRGIADGRLAIEAGWQYALHV